MDTPVHDAGSVPGNTSTSSSGVPPSITQRPRISVVGQATPSVNVPADAATEAVSQLVVAVSTVHPSPTYSLHSEVWLKVLV
jgi:hypothetical protein